jgi:DNA replication and repair protein RecF
MLLTHLSLTNFRNFARLDIDVPGGSVLIVGGNAQGKTSLLESIYYLATFTSFHASQDRQLMSFFSNHESLVVTRIVADFRYTSGAQSINASISGDHRLEVRLIRELDEFGSAKFRKEILLNGVNRKSGEAIGAFNAVLFLPHMLRIIEGSPEERRRYFNLTLGQIISGYAECLSEYNRVISQRNALLRMLKENGGEVEQLSFWDEKLSELGACIIHARIKAVHELDRIASQLHQELTRGNEALHVDYQPAYDPLPVTPNQYPLPINAPIDRSGQSIEQIKRGFLQRLKDIRIEEIQRGITTIGPQRDEFRFISNGIDLGIYGSRGQTRTAVLSFKLAEVTWMTQKTGQMPVLLLDEVLAELDPERRADLLNRLMVSEQALLTTTDLDLFNDHFLSSTRIWQINAGQVKV